MDMLEIQLLGKFATRLDGRPLPGLDNAKVQELLCYLLINRNQAHHREKLSTLLWSECETVGEAKQYLRKAIWKLQRAFENTCFSSSLIIDHEWIEIRHAPDCYWVDVIGLEDAFAALRSLRDAELTPQQAEATAALIDHCTGELMEGRYYEWCIYERERYKLLTLLILDRLTEHYESVGAYDTGCLYGMRILQQDPAREHTHQQLMRMRCKAGDRASALRQFNLCTQVLETELGVTPSPKTVALYEQIRADELADPPPPPPPAADFAQSVQGLPNIMNDLLKLNAVLAETQVQIDKNLQQLSRLR
jgi:DNA-binding SARP family transcriptional activator